MLRIQFNVMSTDLVLKDFRFPKGQYFKKKRWQVDSTLILRQFISSQILIFLLLMRNVSLKALTNMA